jgi:rSAM/selenodomain-associated transferase 1
MRTLGIFAKQPVPGRVKTRLAADWGNERAAALYECFVRDLLDKFATAGDRRVIGFAPGSEEAQQWFEATSLSSTGSESWILWPQPDSDLGGRMAACFRTWTESPDHRTILIGSDSPTLPVEYLERAWRLLEDNDCVIGPAADGGYYLIGLRGSVSDFAAPFRDVEWSTAGVLSQTVALLKKHNLSLGLLPVWYDVDSVAAVATLSGHLSALKLTDAATHLPHTERFLANADAT